MLRAGRFSLVVGWVWLMACSLGWTPAHAQSAQGGAGTGGSYITPFPPGDVYKLQVYGDQLADDLMQGMPEALGPAEQVDVARKYRQWGTLTRAEYEDDIRAEEQARDEVHIGVLMFGIGDRNPVRVAGGKALPFGSPGWKEQYGQRLDRMFRALKRRGIAVYIVGVPPLRRGDANADAAVINEQLLEHSLANGLRFIDIAEGFTDETGAFTQYGPDTAGNRNKLRDGDGVGFTQAGARKLAVRVAVDIKRDLLAARSERSVPLAGEEAEQRRINPDKAGATPSIGGGKLAVARASSVQQASQSPGAQPAGGASAADAAQAGLKLDTSRVTLRFQGLTGHEDTAQLTELVRPPISAAVIALLTRKEAQDSSQQPFDLLIDDIGGGLSVATLVATPADTTAGANRRRGVTAQAAYAAVWVKGERLPSKPGRVDDFSWPRPDVYETEAQAPSSTVAPTVARRGRPAGR